MVKTGTICRNLIAEEFYLKGSSGYTDEDGKGFIDILAFDSVRKRFVVFELKLYSARNAHYQAMDYREYIEKNFEWVYVNAKNKCPGVLPEDTQINRKADIILVAKKFQSSQIDKAKDAKNAITLIKYNWFENDVFLIDYHDKAKTGGTGKPAIPNLQEWQDIVNIKCDKDFKHQLSVIVPTRTNRNELRKIIRQPPEHFNFGHYAAIWQYIVVSINRKELREELCAVSYTKENVKKLQRIIEHVQKPATRNTSLTTKLDDLLALLKKLD